MMKKKVKKIPKYNTGTISANVLDNAMAGRFQTPSASSLGTNQYMASMYAHKNAISNTTVSEQKSGSLPSGIATASNKMLMDTFGIEDNSREGVTLNAAAQGSDIGGSIMPGWGHLIGGIAGGLIGSFKQGSVDVNTGEITYGGIFGRSGHSLRAESNRIKNNIRAKTMTQGIQADYYNDPNVQIQPVLVSEGGIMRKPVDALVSKGELIYNPITKKLSQVPGSKGKPNKKDDVYTRLYEGDVVISNSPTMLMANGKTPAQNLERLVDRKPREQEIHTDGFRARTPRMYKSDTLGAIEMMIKKVVNWQEANKTKPQEYAKFSEGTYYVDGQRAIYRHGRWWWNEGGKKDAQGKMYFVPYTGKSTPSETEPIKHTSETPIGILDPAYRRHVPDTSVTSENKTVNKPSSGKKTTASRVTTSTVPSPEDTVVRRPVYEEPVKTVTAPVDDTKVYGRDGSVRYDYTTPERKVTPADLGRTTNNNNSYTGSNWRDNIYRMAVLSQPLWDRAEAEPVNYESPVYKYMPTAIDVSSQLRDTDQSYALARYNFANLYPNTGAGMAAGLQAASNRAKQYADIRQWQTNAQNELIGKNVGIYNNWANEHVRIMNSVYDKTAANRAAARNINRQNRAAALSNYGQMLKDDKQFAMDTMKLQMMEPMMQYGYENYDDYLKWKKTNGYG